MNKLIFASAAALALAIPAVAQDMAVDANGNVYVLTPSQQTIYDAWPADRQTSYTAWPNDYKVYYWTLTEPQQTGWWALTDAQRQQLYAMTPEARATAWASIESQMANSAAGAGSTGATSSTSATASTGAAGTSSTMETDTMAASTSTSATGSAGMPQMVGGEVVQSAPAAHTGDYPLCSATVTDSCINPREAGKNYGNRPLNYWPGKPASEMPGAKPQQ